jgi:RsiW-degrading membrane proteinase PrsW (M82 family)
MQSTQSLGSLPVVPTPTNSWWRVLLVGVLFFILSLLAMIVTGNPNLFPTVFMIGNFLVPVTFVAFFYDRRHLSRLTVPSIVQGFVYGGILGVLAASILEPLFIRQMNVTSTFSIGLIEEFVKIFGVLVIARRRRHDAEMDGLILGAAAGMGFAALESNGYAFSAFLFSGGSLSLTVYVTLLRGFLSPIGHGTWTAILASVLFRESSNGHFHLNYKVIVAYLIVSLLHALWDGLPDVIGAITGSGFDVFISQSLIGLTGLVILWRRWREAVRLQEANAIPVAEEYSLSGPEDQPQV